ncbi:hypothetical protein CMV_000785 [Castanea mollissima]|uniref:Uncharacterized protein n=1 Tax=Castanea mollissima TaxID=60419 RepID=A0A8J4RLU8_9ROSI|nr:hypothetical protein CMV_000785 [Castanea mollissima]
MDLVDPNPKNPDLPTTCNESEDESAVAKELVASDDDESRTAIDGLGVDLGESGEERVDEVWAKTVLVIVADEC